MSTPHARRPEPCYSCALLTERLEHMRAIIGRLYGEIEAKDERLGRLLDEQQAMIRERDQLRGYSL